MDGISGMDKTSFDAQVVSKTLDTMNNRSPMQNAMTQAPMDKETFGAAVVSGTLSAMNAPANPSDGGMSQTYNLSQDVLSAYTGTGSIMDSTG